MTNLASALYEYARQGTERLDTLTGYVNDLLEAGTWKGQPASGRTIAVFMASYGADAAIMAGMDKIVVAAGQVIDNLAAQLATLESKLERELETPLSKGWLVQEWAPDGGPYFTGNPKFVNSPDPKVHSAVMELWNKLGEDAARYQRQADIHRAKAAEIIMALAEKVQTGLDYYMDKTGPGHPQDAGGLFTEDQRKSDKLGIDRLKKQLAAEQGKVHFDRQKVAADMQQYGGELQTIGGLVMMIKPLAPYGATVETIGQIVGSIGVIAGTKTP
ncbi:hypothetical protein ACFFNX_20740 [Actinoallomurus acaciae]|uniref:WXG100 family type VII secretion target n=2 Tax=Actinoallomurus acaciae TaxID=502577 RepID=A0ABV5YJ85_9ACTN